MVAIAVILAAVVASFVLGIADNTGDSTPQTVITDSYDGQQNVTLTVESGDPLDPSLVTVEGSITDTNGSGINSTGQTLDTAPGISDSLRAGDQVVVGVTDSDYEIELIYQSDSGDSSILAEFSGPDN